MTSTLSSTPSTKQPPHFVSLTALCFRSGLTVPLLPDSICVLVGPNNAGKSATLSDVAQLLRIEEHVGITLSTIEIDRKTTQEEIKSLFAPYRDSNGHVSYSGMSFHEFSLNGWWEPNSRHVGDFFAQLSVCDLSTRARLSDCDPVTNGDTLQPTYVPSHPYQRMYLEPDLERKVSSAFRRAFKTDFLIHRASGSMIPAFVGPRPKAEKTLGLFSLEYQSRIAQLSRLESQGDGMRSFGSVIGRIITEQRPIQLIDEPEAFLHPPQARLIGELIAAESLDRQTLLATHSSDILQGVLASGKRDVSVVRLSRTKVGGRASHLANDKISQLWRDPILRFSKVMDGLFHDAVVFAEGDADCRFYEAMAEIAVSPPDRPDVLYAYSGGKSRLPVLIRALHAVDVPVVSIVDFDVLNNDDPLNRIVEASGGDWSKLKPHWRRIKGYVEADPSFLKADEFADAINEALARIGSDTTVPKRVVSEIKKLAKNASPWGPVKSKGLDYFTNSAERDDAERFLYSLRELGVFVVPVGEMENFCPDVSRHGPKWVAEVMGRDLTAASFSSAQKFAADIYGHLRSTVSA